MEEIPRRASTSKAAAVDETNRHGAGGCCTGGTCGRSSGIAELFAKRTCPRSERRRRFRQPGYKRVSAEEGNRGAAVFSGPPFSWRPDETRYLEVILMAAVCAMVTRCPATVAVAVRERLDGPDPEGRQASASASSRDLEPAGVAGCGPGAVGRSRHQHFYGRSGRGNRDGGGRRDVGAGRR